MESGCSPRFLHALVDCDGAAGSSLNRIYPWSFLNIADKLVIFNTLVSVTCSVAVCDGFTVPVSRNGLSSNLILKSSICSVTIEDSKFCLIHGIRVWWVLYSGPYRTQLSNQYILCFSHIHLHLMLLNLFESCFDVQFGCSRHLTLLKVFLDGENSHWIQFVGISCINAHWEYRLAHE